MKRRAMLVVIGLVVSGLALPAGSAAPASPKEETVTLAVTGMT